MKNIRIAIQSRGRLAEPSQEYLKTLGITFSPIGRNCMATCSSKNIDVLFLRDDDIPEYVERGVADFGIVGENVLLEKRVRVNLVKRLGFGRCSIVISVPVKSDINLVTQLKDMRIATSYPDILRQFLQIQNVTAEIIEIKGSAEIAPSLNLADAICDLTQSGRTLKENNLRTLCTIFESQAVLIQTPYAVNQDAAESQSTFLNTLAS